MFAPTRYCAACGRLLAPQPYPYSPLPTLTTTINALPPTAGAGDRDLEGDRDRKSIDEG